MARLAVTKLFLARRKP